LGAGVRVVGWLLARLANGRLTELPRVLGFLGGLANKEGMQRGSLGLWPRMAGETRRAAPLPIHRGKGEDGGRQEPG